MGLPLEGQPLRGLCEDGGEEKQEDEQGEYPGARVRDDAPWPTHISSVGKDSSFV